MKVASIDPITHDFVNVGGDLYLLEPTETISGRGRVRHLVPATGEDTIIYTTDEDPSGSPFAQHTLDSLIATEKYLYFLKRGDGGNALMQLPRAGGTATRIAPNLDLFDDDSQIIGADEHSVYVFEVNSQTNDLARISLADGTLTNIAEHDGQQFTDMQILNGRFYYSANEGLDGIYSAPLDATAPADVQVTPDGCVPFAMSVTPAGILCGDAFNVTSTPLTGGASTNLWALTEGGVDVSLPDDGFVYLRPYAEQDNPLRKLPITGGDATAIACHRDAISHIHFDAGHVYWIEDHAGGSREIVMVDK